MKSGLDWNDLVLFCAVARAGNLTAATTATGVSAATLSRRMRALEAASGRRLFLRGTQGYALSREGQALLDRAERMEAAAAEIGQWQAQGTGPARVRISAGSWTSLYLTRHLPAFWSARAVWVPEFVQCNIEMDIARREVDIGIRNSRPRQPWLAGQRTSYVDYAVYGRDAKVQGWIGATEDAVQIPSARWVQAHHANALVTRVNDPRLALELAGSGVGRVVLPCFVGAHQTGLVQLSDPIEELRSEEWLVSHHEGRHDPAIRAALNALGAYLSGTSRAASAA